MLENIGFVVKPFKQKTSIDPSHCFYTQMPFEKMRLDFALYTARLAIEVDGSYWHGSRTKSLTTKQVIRTLDDAAKKQKLTEEGWKLLTIIDSDLKRECFQNVLKKRIWDMIDV